MVHPGGETKLMDAHGTGHGLQSYSSHTYRHVGCVNVCLCWEPSRGCCHILYSSSMIQCVLKQNQTETTEVMEAEARVQQT